MLTFAYHTPRFFADGDAEMDILAHTLGANGTGKTTLLRYLALTYARDLRDGSGVVAQRLELAEQETPGLRVTLLR